ncbi:MAG TPA: DNA alkylation repair protein [Candidatus Limnocylindrales bacterium]|nr:DNA alkylation repair protein [Candidatus Limnocylindrales bacterium]
MTATASPITLRADALVAERLPEARLLATRLADELQDPQTFVSALRDGLRRLADPVHAETQASTVPGARGLLGVRAPLLAAVAAGLRGPLAEASPAIAIYLADALSRAAEHELKLFALVPLRRSLAADPERTWQLLRRLAREAGDWETVDSLAGLAAEGILQEPYRWAELEQLVYSPHRWERRLAAATVAVIPFRVRPPERAARLGRTSGLMIIESLLGDAEPEVQKALAWALRSWREVDAGAVARLLRAEAAAAAARRDGHRAWVLREALSGAGADAALAAEIRARLAGVRRQAGTPGTSRALQAAAAFRGLPDARLMAEPPL